MGGGRSLSGSQRGKPGEAIALREPGRRRGRDLQEPTSGGDRLGWGGRSGEIPCQAISAGARPGEGRDGWAPEGGRSASGRCGGGEIRRDPSGTHQGKSCKGVLCGSLAGRGERSTGTRRGSLGSHQGKPCKGDFCRAASFGFLCLKGHQPPLSSPCSRSPSPLNPTTRLGLSCTPQLPPPVVLWSWSVPGDSCWAPQP